MKNKDNNFYSNKVVYKPWGYEYIIYRDSNRLAITYVKINPGHKTSLHCHPKKKTGFIILSGNAVVQIGIYKKNVQYHKSVSRLVLRPGLFHSIKATSKQGVEALEFETPFIKKDLIRFKDEYGRKNKAYEGTKFTKNINSGFIRFKKPKLGKKNIYKLSNLKILLEKRKNLKHLPKKDDKTSLAILDGNIVDNKGQKVISYGEIIKTSTLKILSERFRVKKPITLLRVYKKSK
jgi:mannose-6-phosphate isomerase-like protein (cupin superfamily)